VVHDEDHGRSRLDREQALVVCEAESDPVQQLCHTSGEPGSNPEVDVGVERRDDLLRIPPDLDHRHVVRHAVLQCVGLGRLHHLGVVHQSIDQDLTLGELEGLDPDVEVLADLVEDPLDPPPEKPPHAGHQQAVEGSPAREHDECEQQPKRHADLLKHPVDSRTDTSITPSGIRLSRPVGSGWFFPSASTRTSGRCCIAPAGT